MPGKGFRIATMDPVYPGSTRPATIAWQHDRMADGPPLDAVERPDFLHEARWRAAGGRHVTLAMDGLGRLDRVGGSASNRRKHDRLPAYCRLAPGWIDDDASTRRQSPVGGKASKILTQISGRCTQSTQMGTG
jgi:hypothetical protein